MNWNSLGAWLNKDDTPDLDKLVKRGISVVYIDPRSANAASAIASLRSRNILPGLYAVAGWDDSWTAHEFALWCSSELNRLLPKDTLPEAPPFMVDIEKPRIRLFAAGFLVSYRTFQPARPSSYTNEPFQGGLIPTSALALQGFHWYPQCYYGNMAPADAAAVCLEAAREFRPDRIHPFYDGKLLPSDARDGCVFTADRLP